ncbi:cobalt ECF transporter T component CbiQ [Pseudonocardia sp. C8]|uniref:cobalt ECF transporter T component CbiQ n=1 Tax=Pseudonocardia sp. C8 TaxID=2762759 RepID=UPI0016435E12|nr:cobalt ECF transporter T component CbiQ [Pseudonocardia sp. C8]MBC3194905.1 cobalt ECF transporter T component CbiQ [Pseudonocardia sp. C8]
MLLIDEVAHTNRWRARHPGEKALLSLGLLALAVGLPPWPGAVLTATASLALLVVGARIPPRTVLRLLRLPLGFVVVGTMPLLITLGGDPWIALAPDGPFRAAELLGRSMAAVSCLILFAATTPLADSLPRLRFLPPAVTEITLLVYRMMFLLLDTLCVVRDAQALRMGFRGRRATYRSLACQGSTVFIRAFERARRMESGLGARGYDGTLRVRVAERKSSPAFIAASLLLLGGVVLVTLVMIP